MCCYRGAFKTPFSPHRDTSELDRHDRFFLLTEFAF
jgi:hypothetical protein